MSTYISIRDFHLLSDLTLTLKGANGLAWDLANGLQDLVFADDIGTEIALKVESVSRRAGELCRGPHNDALQADVRELAPNCAHIRARAGRLAQDLGNATGRASSENLAHTLVRDLDRACDLASTFTRDDVLADVLAQREARRMASLAVRLLAGAARTLPAADRARYTEEYRSELWDLTQAGAGSLGQLEYALRQLCSAPRTGLALRSPRRRGAAS